MWITGSGGGRRSGTPAYNRLSPGQRNVYTRAINRGESTQRAFRRARQASSGVAFRPARGVRIRFTGRG